MISPFGGIEAASEKPEPHLDGLLPVVGGGASHCHFFAPLLWGFVHNFRKKNGKKSVVGEKRETAGVSTTVE